MSGQHLFLAGRAADACAGLAAEQLRALLKRTQGNEAAPKAFTGCVSDISACRQIDIDGDYAVALKAYSAVYEAAQAYLQPGEHAVEHDYGLCAEGEQDGHGAHVAAQLQATERERVVNVSDEEVERCGYLGWLRH